MNTKLLLIAGLVIAGGVGAFLLLRPKSAGPGIMTGGQETVSSSFAELMKMGKDYQCTFTTTDEKTGTTNGAVYVADKGANFSGTFTTQPTTGDQTETHVVRSGEYTYVWTAGQTQGYKMKIDPESEELFAGGDDKSEQTVIDEDATMDFNCEAWRPQASMFVVPSDIEFTDFSAQMEMMQQYTAPTSTDQEPDTINNCNYCAGLEGDTKAQCLTAMGC